MRRDDLDAEWKLVFLYHTLGKLPAGAPAESSPPPRSCFSWLAEVRPDLLSRYDQIYGRRSYAPKAIQDEITTRFRSAFDAVRRSG